MLLTVLFSTYYSHIILKTAYSNSADRSAQMSDYFNERLKNIIEKVYAMKNSNAFSESSALSQFVLGDSDVNQNYAYTLAFSDISDKLTELRSSDRFIFSAYIYTPKGDFYDQARVRTGNFNFLDTRIYRDISPKRDFVIQWCEPEEDEIYVGNTEVVPLVIPLSVSGYSQTCYIVVNLDEEAMLDYLKMQSNDGRNLLVVTDDGRQIAAYWNHTRPADTRRLVAPLKKDRDIVNLKVDRDDYVVTYDKIQIAPWKIIEVQSRNFLTRDLHTARIFVAAIAVASILLCFFFSVLISRTITRPLAYLESTIRQVTRRNFNIQFRYHYRDEVGRLGQSFNFMIGEIKSLIDQLHTSIHELSEEKEKVKTEQVMKRKAELKALQAQINPHFLYNTLDSIVWMAEAIDAKDISRMASSLGKLFKISLSKGNEFITLEEEREHVESYLRIQQIRYGDKIHYHIDFAREILGMRTIKLIVQPFVENSIGHGFKGMDRPGHIEIGGRLTQEGDIELTVADDGGGIPPDRLGRINQALERAVHSDSQGYGIYNVNERIRLYFGSRYGVRLAGRPKGGTRATIRVPAHTTPPTEP